MKIINLKATNSKELEKEISMMSKLNHRNIIKYIGSDGNKLLMEYFAGQPLEDIIDEGVSAYLCSSVFSVWNQILNTGNINLTS